MHGGIPRATKNKRAGFRSGRDADRFTGGGMLVGSRGLVGAALLLMAIPGAGSAQQRAAVIGGAVRDGDGRPLDGASIEILGTKFKATTGEAGTYRFEQVPAGRYWILARRIG